MSAGGPEPHLALGTAQLGQPYGVANQTGKPAAQAATMIIESAIEAGVAWFDTAQSYGDAEERLGAVLTRHPDTPFSVVTKLAAEVAIERPSAIREAIERSVRRIGRPLAGVLLHDPGQLESWSRGPGEALAVCRNAGLAERVGVSVYSPAQLTRALELEGVSIIQAPYNVIDRRVERAGLLQRARERGVRVMLRSAFLQGLLVMDPSRRPAWSGFAGERLRAWDACWRRACRPPEEIALRFILDRQPEAVVPVGCETEQQLRGILAAASSPALDAALLAELEPLASEDEALVDPRRWPMAA